MASKSLSLSLSGYFGDVNFCLWLVNVAHAHLMRWSNSTWNALSNMMSWPRYLISPFWRHLDVHPSNLYCITFLGFDVVLEMNFGFVKCWKRPCAVVPVVKSSRMVDGWDPERLVPVSGSRSELLEREQVACRGAARSEFCLASGLVGVWCGL